MDLLAANLESARRKRNSDAVWAAVDAAAFVLAEFRARVQAGALALSEGEDPHYTFDPAALEAPPGAAFAVGAWAKHADLVLGVLRRASELDVLWEGEGRPIELRAPKPAAVLLPLAQAPAPFMFLGAGPPPWRCPACAADSCAAAGGLALARAPDGCPRGLAAPLARAPEAAVEDGQGLARLLAGLMG
jgi:hypothetical protein